MAAVRKQNGNNRRLGTPQSVNAVVGQAARVAFLLGGRPVWLEEYVDVRTDLPLDPFLFDPQRFAAARPRD